MTTAAGPAPSPITKDDERWRWTLALASLRTSPLRPTSCQGAPNRRQKRWQPPSTLSDDVGIASACPDPAPRFRCLGQRQHFLQPKPRRLHSLPSSPTTVDLLDNGRQPNRLTLLSRINRSATALPWQNDARTKTSNEPAVLPRRPLSSNSRILTTLPPHQKRKFHPQ